MGIPTALAVLAGARRDVLAKAPGDLPKHAAMGGVLLTTATVAGVSAFFALYSVLELPPQVCVLGGIGWAVVVLNLDRMLVVTMSRRHSLPLKIAMAVPRLLLALVIGAVISTPLVLQIFQPEIEAELKTMKANALDQWYEAQKGDDQRIDELRAKVRQLQETRDHKLPHAVDDDPDVQAAKADYDHAKQNYDQRQNEAQAELDGTGGTRRPGVGRSYLEKEKAADLAKSELDAATARLNVARTQTQTRLAAADEQAAKDAANALPAVEHDLAVQEQHRRDAQDEEQAVQNRNTGLLARLKALNRVTEGDLTAATAHWMLFLLFVCIEVLPVVAKLLSTLGPPSLYDRLTEHEDEHAYGTAHIKATSEREIIQIQADANLTEAKQKASAQVEAAKAVNEALADKRKAIALRARNEELDRLAYELDFRDFQ